MKSLSCTLLLFFSISLSAQPYLPVLEAEKVWNNALLICDVGGGLRVELGAQDTIDGRQYQKVDYYTCDRRVDWGHIRSSPDHAQLWFNPACEPGEVLIMDLNLRVGDRFDASHLGYVNPSELIVSRVDTVDGRKIVAFEELIPSCGIDLSLAFVEGIGPRQGFFSLGGWGGSSAMVNCVQRGDSTVYQEPVLDWFDCDEDCIRTGLDEVEWEVSSYRVYPNPTSEAVFLEGPRSGGHFEIVNVTGKVVRRGVLDQSRVEVDLWGLSRGLYLVRFYQQEEYRATPRLILVDAR